LSNTINIRGKILYKEFAIEVKKERFEAIYSELKPEVIAIAWQELLKATGRKELEKPKRSTTSKSRKKTSK